MGAPDGEAVSAVGGVHAARPGTTGGVRVAQRRDLLPVLAVLVLSFDGAGDSLGGARDTVRGLWPALRAAIDGERVLVSRGGLTYAWLEKEPGTWYVHSTASLPRGRGHGSRVLEDLLRRADEARVTVVLHCSRARVAWYRRHGFLPAPVTRSGQDQRFAAHGHVKLRRHARRVPPGRDAPAAAQRFSPATA